MTLSTLKNTLIHPGYGWQIIEENDFKLCFKGYLIDSNEQQIHSELTNLLRRGKLNLTYFSSWLNSLNGHFAIILITPVSIFAAVDKVNTIPLFYSSKEGSFFVSNKASLLNENQNLISSSQLNNQAALEIAMSGYTIGSKTLCKEIYQLTSGECLKLEEGNLEMSFYYTYSPWKVIQRNEYEFYKDFNETLNLTMLQLVESLHGRQAVIPLSAGNDSRLIVSALKHFGVENVLCFSYGRKGNFESEIASAIANKLGYNFKHIDISGKDKKNFFKSKKFRSYIEDYESFSSIPAVQDIVEISYLKENNLIDEDAIIINGNSGDFISGGHILNMEDSLCTSNNLWLQFFKKHYSLWGSLKTNSNELLIKEQINEIITDRKIPNFLDGDKSPFMYEVLEYLGRQSMYVVNQQDAYDFNHYDWRLPLWSDSFLTFWETVPYEYKFNQNLYTKVLHKNNWGGVWHDIPLNEKKIRPHWIRPLRFASKAFISPFGKDIWHSFEKHFFLYWMDLTRNSVITPYHKVLLDNDGHKNMFSWISKEYLEQKNFFIK